MPDSHPGDSLTSRLIGRPRWAPAPWMSSTRSYTREHPLKSLLIAGLLLIILVCTVISWRYYQSLPQPLRWAPEISVPGASPLEEDGPVIQPLKIVFAPEDGRDAGEPARLDLINQQVYEGVALSPQIEGQWRWEDGRTLVFDPEQDWPANTEYSVTYGPEAFAESVKLARNEQRFTTAAFTASLENIEFHQDPTRREDRRVFATLQFSHPVQVKGLEEAITLSMRPPGSSGSGNDTARANQPFTVSVGEYARTAYIKSDPITLPQQANTLRLALSRDLRSHASDGTSNARLSAAITGEVRIPDRESFFRVVETSLRMLRDAEDTPRQTLLLNLTDDISSAALTQALSVYLLPKRDNNQRWSRPGQVTPAVLDSARELHPEPQPLPRKTHNLHSYRLEQAAGREIYIRIKPGLTSAHDFTLASEYAQVLTLPDYPREATIRSEGALLSRGGQRQLSLMARGLPGLKVEIGRVQSGSINHLVSQTGGDLNDPYFQNYQFSEDDIVSWNEKIIPLAPANPRDPVYTTLDLAPWLDQPLGLFFIRVKGWDPAKKRVIYAESDKRLILVSDLGLLVKRAAAGGDQVFVQSVRSGKAVSNAQVDLLGRNGVSIFSASSDANGHLNVPDYSKETGAREPMVYVVRQGEDIAFIPWQRAERRLGYSRFDVGGAYSRNLSDDALNAYVFSDRGIYRPGESAHVGIVLRRNDLAVSDGVPLEITVIDPKGASVKSQRRTLGAKGFLELEYQTQAWSSTGDYQAQVYLVNARGNPTRLLGSTVLKVEEFQPDKLRIKSEYQTEDAKQPAGWISNLDVTASVALQNLFGTPAQDRRVTGELRLVPTQFRFDAFPGYAFSDPDRESGDGIAETRSTIEQTLAETRTNDQGLASFELDLQQFARGLWRVNFFAQGFEAGGGRGVSTAHTALVSPAAHLIGVKADGALDYIRRNSERRLQLVAVDNDLQPITLNNLSLRRARRVPVSTLVQAENGSYSYQSMQQREPLDESDYSLPSAGDSILLDTQSPGDYVLDVVNADEQVLASVDYTVAGASNTAARLERSVELGLTLDKKKYKAGDEIELQITAPYTGAGLITIERDRVYAYKWFNSDNLRSIQTIKIPKNLEGNAYVNVAFLRAIDSPEVYASPLSYAVAPFALDREKRELDLEINTPRLARPGVPMHIKYQVDQTARLAVFAVDEGILQVANYKTPSPLDYFLQKRALEVDTQQILDLLLPEINLLQNTAAAGGGDGANALGRHLNPFARRGYKPAVFWSGLQDVAAGAGEFSYTPPDNFNGELRVMAVAIGDERMRSAQQSTTVRAPFVITPSLPTAVAPGDEFVVSVGVSNALEGAGSVPITLALEVGSGLKVMQAKNTSLTLDEGNEGRVTFRLKARQDLGPATLKFKASGADTESRLATDISIRPATPYQSTLQAGFTGSGQIEVALDRDLYPERAQRQATASASPLALVDGLNGYLAEFAHYCTEQIISQVFPLLTFIDQPKFIARYLHDAGHNKGQNDSPSLESVIGDLRARQLSSGGFELWPGQGQAEAWASVHAMLFLTQAQQRGQAVPNTVIERGKQYLRDVAAEPSRSLAAARVRAQAIYLLTQAGERTTNDLVHLHEGLERDHTAQWRGDVVAAWMAASYVLLQERAEGEALIEAYTPGRPLAERQKPNLAEYDSVLAQDAQFLWLLAQQFPDRLQRLDPAFLQDMLQPAFTGGYNTLSSAWTVLALGAYQQRINPANAAEITFAALDAKNKPLPVTATDAPYPQVSLPAAAQALRIDGPDKLFYSALTRGYNNAMPEQAQSQGLEVDRSFFDVDGNPVETFSQGQEITVRLRVRSSGAAVENGVIIDLLPGGFEVDTDSIDRQFDGWRADYVDVRDDRVLVYGRIDNRSRELSYTVRATSAGRFTLPPVYAESMYNRALRAHSAGGHIEIAPAEQSRSR